MAKIWISEIEFNDGTIVPVGENEIVVFVGPNNAGKSATLKELEKLLRSKKNAKVTSKIVREIKIEKSGSDDDFMNFVDGISIREMHQNPEPHFKGYGFNIYAPQLRGVLEKFQDGLGEAVPIFLNVLGTEGRLVAANPAPNIRLTTDSIQHPIHFLQKNDALEKEFSKFFKQAFGLDLIVHRNAGNEVPLYVGEKPELSSGEDRVSHSYLEKIDLLDKLHEQGDGMRSFVGVLLSAFISNHSMLFIDEPEAFLHPPQARLLGTMLSGKFPSKRQLFLATHSEDLLKGLLDDGANRLKIIRIQRDKLSSKISILRSDDIKDVWSDSLLRHSNILSGLFHKMVVVCESDSDCRFYSAVLSSVHSGSDALTPDVLFIHCGGKYRVPVVVKSLMRLNVSLKVISDFDVLNGENPIRGIYSELGGDWDDIKNDWNLVKGAIEQRRPELESADLKKEIEEILNSVNERVFPKDKLNKIQASLKKASAWAHAKSVGKDFIPSGDPMRAFNRLQKNLENIGFFVLGVGELEGFVRSVGNHGPKWVSEVLQKDLKNDSELEAARIFLNKVIA